MKDSKRRSNRIYLFLSVTEIFNGFSGLLGGIKLIADPTGSSLEMTTSWLEGTPFTDFLIPGIILFAAVGLGNVVAMIQAIRRHPHAAGWAVVFGAVLMVWIIVQVALVGYQGMLQPFYFLTGGLQLLIGLYLMKITQS